MSLHTIVYTSSATVPFTLAQLNSLLAAARESNEKAGITGMLLYHDGNFMQCLEGPQEAVQITYDRISSDRGHTGVICLVDEPTSQRLFEGWQMGFLEPARAEWEGLSKANWERAVATGGQAEQSDGFALLQEFARLVR